MNGSPDRANARESRSRPLPAFGIALGLAALFFLGATLLGDHTVVVRGAGALWVFLLGLIAALPLVGPRRRRDRGEAVMAEGGAGGAGPSSARAK